MKKTTKIWMALLVFVAMLEAAVVSVAATTGDSDTTGGIVLAIVFAGLGIVLLVAMFKKIKGVPKTNPVFYIIGAVIMFVIAACAGGFMVLPNLFAVEPEDDDIVLATFDITPSGSTTGILTADKEGFKVPAYADQTNYTIIQVDNSTAWVDPVFTFECEPEMFPGAQTLDMAQLVVEITNPDLSIDTSTDDYYLVTKSGGHRQWVLDIGGKTKYVTGSCQMDFTENVTITVTPTINQGSFARMEDIYSPVSAYIKFANSPTNPTWTETFKIEFMLTNIWT